MLLDITIHFELFSPVYQYRLSILTIQDQFTCIRFMRPVTVS